MNLSVLGQSISGYVVSAHSTDSLSGVHIFNKTNSKGTVSNLQGHFNIAANLNDSIIFSSVGYHNAYYIVHDSMDFKKSLSISMISDTIVLKEVYVIGLKDNYLERQPDKPIKVPGIKPLDNPEPVEPMSFEWGNSSGSEPNDISVLGLQGTLYGPLSYFNKEEKEKRKMAKIKKQESDMAVFDRLVASDKTKQMICEAFKIGEQEYDKMTGAFCREYKALISVSNEEEILGLLIQYFSRESK